MQEIPVRRDEWLTIVRQTPFGSTFETVAVTLAGYATPDGQRAWPGRQQLVDDTSLGHRTVDRVLAQLLGAGLIECVAEATRNRHAVYRLTKPRPAPPTFLPPRLDV